MVVQHNMQAANANRMLGITTGAQAKSTEKLSSGYKINRAADDAAGLAISEKMRSQIRGLDRASTNAQDGISVVQTAEGALNEVHSMLQRMNELATQAANDTNTTIDRSQIQLEVDQLTSEIDRVSSTTQFNTQNLLDGTFQNKNLQVGSLSGQKIELNIGKMSAEGLGLAGKAEAQYYTDTTAASHGKVSYKAGEAAPTVPGTQPSKPGDIFSNYKVGTGTGEVTASTKYIYDGNNTWHQDGLPGTTITLNFKSGYDAKVGAEFTSGTDTTANITTQKDLETTSTPADLNDLKIAESDLNNAKADTYVYDSTTKKWTGKATNTELTVDTTDIPTGKSLVDGSEITIGEGTKAHNKGDKIEDSDRDLTLKVDSFANAGDAMDRIQKAIDKVSTQRAQLGAVQNRLEHTIANLDNVSENTQAAESRIRDTDMAKEMVTYSKNNILAQAGQSMLAQANQSNQGVLSLLQ